MASNHSLEVARMEHKVLIELHETAIKSLSIKEGDIKIYGWKFLDKIQKKRVLDELMKDIKLEV